MQYKQPHHSITSASASCAVKGLGPKLSTSEAEILPLEDHQGLLQGLDLLLPCLLAVLIAEARIKAVSLQLLVVLQGLVQFFLCELELLLCGAEQLRGCVFLALLVLLFHAFDRKVLVGLVHELLVRSLGLVLRHLRFSLQAREVR